MQRFTEHARDQLPEQTALMDELEAGIAGWEDRFRRMEGVFHTATAETERQRSHTAHVLLAFHATAIAARVTNLGNALVILINRRHVHAAPAIARALFETGCVPLYMRLEIATRLRAGRTNAVHRLLFRLGLGGTRDFGVGHIKNLSVSSFLEAARRDLDELERKTGRVEPNEPLRDLVSVLYGPLTDLTHPNWAATASSTSLAAGRLPTFILQPDFEDLKLGGLLDAATYAMSRGGDALDDVINTARAFPMDLPNGEPEWLPGDRHHPVDAETADS